VKQAEAERMAETHMAYAYKVAHEHASRFGLKYPGVDIDGAANEAMAEAVRTWEKGKGSSFKTWLARRVCFRVRESWRAAMQHRCNRKDPITKVHSIEGYLDNMHVLGIEHPLCFLLPAIEAADVEGGLEGYGEACVRLERQLGVCLSLRERDVLIAYAEHGTMKRAADYLGVSESRVCQIVGVIRRRIAAVAAERN